MTLKIFLIDLIKIVKPGSNEDESRRELSGESLHECFLNSHWLVKRAVRVNCMRVDKSLSSFFDFLVFARCFYASFSSFFDACQTASRLILISTLMQLS